jgi:hypothetical protein
MNSNVDDSVTVRRLGTAIAMMCLGTLGLVVAAIIVGRLFG